MSLDHPNQHHNPDTVLSPEHRRMLDEGSDISRPVAAARGYRTITRTADLPPEFPDWQRRRGLLVRTHSPDGETTGYQLRPDKPIKRKKGKPPKYETPAGSRITLDSNPEMAEEVRAGSGELWTTEGCKKVDALASRGIPAVGIIGVWNFAEPDTKSTRPLPCWSHVRTRGRRVYVCYDADARTNPDVQEALRRLVAMLEGMGARPLVVYLPPVNGDGKAGVDDYLAAGGTVEELRELAAPYEPVDIAAERMGRDDRLRAAVADVRRRWRELAGNGRAACSLRDVGLQLVEAAPTIGKIHHDGIRIEGTETSWGTLMLGAKVSRATLKKAICDLEDMGFLYRDNAGRKQGKAGAFVLRAKVDHYGRERGEGKGQTTGERESGRSGLPLRGLPDVPRQRWSSPGSRPRRGLVAGTRKVRQSQPPEPRPAVKRLGKIRGAILDVLDLAGGSASLREIADALQRNRPRDIRRRLLPWLIEAGIVAVEGDRVSLTADWRERLGVEMWNAGEPEADEKDRSALKIRRAAFHHRRRPRPASTPRASLDAVQRSRARRDAEMRRTARPVSELERPPAPAPELVEALRRARPRWPDHAHDYPSWWASTLYVEDYLPTKPTPAAVELALHDLDGVPA
jgi:hypothetical protein